MLDGAVDLARDRELVQRCQEGDEQAFAELYQRYQRRLHRLCMRRLHATDDAEEAVQEAFARAWRALPRFAGERRFYPWLTVIAGNVCTDVLRRRSRTVPMGDVATREVDAGAPEVDEQLLREVDLALASEALENLSDRHRRVLRLREGTEWSAQRIAEHEGLAAPAVDTLLWRARQAFKREFLALSETGGGLAAVLGIGVASLRRSLWRLGARASSVLGAVTSVPRSTGALAATVVVAGAAIAGGSVALIGQGPVHTTLPSVDTTVGVPSGVAGGLGSSGTIHAGSRSSGTVLGGLGGSLPPPRKSTFSSAHPTQGAVGAGTVSGTVSGAVSGAVSRTVSGATGAVVTAATSTLTAATSVIETVLEGSTTTGDSATGGTSTGTVTGAGTTSGAGTVTGAGTTSGAGTSGGPLTVPGLLGG